MMTNEHEMRYMKLNNMMKSAIQKERQRRFKVQKQRSVYEDI